MHLFFYFWIQDSKEFRIQALKTTTALTSLTQTFCFLWIKFVWRSVIRIKVCLSSIHLFSGSIEWGLLEDLVLNEKNSQKYRRTEGLLSAYIRAQKWKRWGHQDYFLPVPIFRTIGRSSFRNIDRRRWSLVLIIERRALWDAVARCLLGSSFCKEVVWCVFLLFELRKLPEEIYNYAIYSRILDVQQWSLCTACNAFSDRSSQ